MIILQDKNTKFIINITGYEFPDTLIPPDTNWLNADFTLEAGHKVFTRTDPAFLVPDLKRFAAWFRSLGNREKDVQQFIPNLENTVIFEHAGCEDDIVEIILQFWAKDVNTVFPEYQCGRDEIRVVFTLDRKELLEIAEEFDNIVSTFPSRGGDWP